MDNGFIDLRLNGADHQGNDSFWPSFTDIMTVIVMIFLIAMVVLLMRNMELVNQLRTTMAAEQIAAQLALETGKEKDTISANLTTAEEQISALQMQLLQLREQAIVRENKVTQQLKKVRVLTTENYEQLQRLTQAELTRQRLQSDLESKQVSLRSAQEKNLEISAQLETEQSQLAASQQAVNQYQQTISEQAASLEILRENEQKFEKKYLVLVGEHDNLQTKYQKLIRPARSTKGRHLVEVRYSKVKGKSWVRWREGTQGDYTNVTYKQLEQALNQLKSEQANGLYVKIIIPENSGLSYSEAWKFTTKVHKAFDYYFAEETP